MKHRVTASDLPRVMRCAASAALPAVGESNRWSDMGNNDHKVITRASQIGADDALEELSPEERTKAEGIEFDRLPLARPHEVAFAYDPLSGEARVLGTHLDRDYSDVAEWEIPGTADVAGHEIVSEENVRELLGIIRDYKLGFGWAPRVDGHEQLLFLALALARSSDLDRISIGLIFPRGVHPEQVVELDAEQLAKFEEKLLAVLDQVSEARALVEKGIMPDVSMGPWCKYCPAKSSCPGQTALIRSAMEPDSQVDIASATQDLSPDQLGELYVKAKLSYDILGQLLGRIRGIVVNTETPISIGGGRQMAPRTVRGKRVIDGDAAWEVMSARYDQAAAKKAVKLSVSETSIKRGLKAVNVANVAGDLRDVMTELERLGAVEHKPSRVEAKEVNE